MNKKLRPLLKWTGGKFDEFGLFSKHIPTFKRYVEPFFGGGGVFFALLPQVPALINDKSTDLIQFYRQIGNPAFKIELFRYADAWDELGSLTHFLWENCSTDFTNAIHHPDSINDLKEKSQQNLTSFLKNKSTLNEEDFIINLEAFKTMLVFSIADKAKRIKAIYTKEKRNFNRIELFEHFETSIRGGTYLFFRKILNQHYHKQIKLNEAKASANWFFVREFCYGAMFRFNAKGEFNIPYGGIAYNKRKLRGKITKIFIAPITNLFKQANLNNEDFETFLKGAALKTGDFIFVDPPYDSEFSEYDQSAFTQKDQERLASFLIQTPAKWMVVIKETTFIRELYTHPGIKITTFDKNYRYNVRGRNNRGVRHLIIMNY